MVPFIIGLDNLYNKSNLGYGYNLKTHHAHVIQRFLNNVKPYIEFPNDLNNDFIRFLSYHDVGKFNLSKTGILKIANQHKYTYKEIHKTERRELLKLISPAYIKYIQFLLQIDLLGEARQGHLTVEETALNALILMGQLGIAQADEIELAFTLSSIYYFCDAGSYPQLEKDYGMLNFKDFNEKDPVKLKVYSKLLKIQKEFGRDIQEQAKLGKLKMGDDSSFLKFKLKESAIFSNNTAIYTAKDFKTKAFKFIPKNSINKIMYGYDIETIKDKSIIFSHIHMLGQDLEAIKKNNDIILVVIPTKWDLAK